MAITFNSGAYYETTVGSGSSYQASYTCPSLTNGLMVVIPYHGAGSGGTISTLSITFNGDALTEDAQYIGSAFFSAGSIYHRVSPDVATANVIVTTTASVSGRREFGVLLYEGVDQTTPVEDSDSQYTSSGTTFTLNLTTTSVDAWLVGGFKSDSADLTAGGGTTFRTSLTSLGGTLFGSTRYGDSNGGKGAAGNYTMVATLVSSGDAGEVGIAIRASADTANTTNFFYSF